jgi:hypothetical protein
VPCATCVIAERFHDARVCRFLSTRPRLCHGFGRVWPSARVLRTRSAMKPLALSPSGLRIPRRRLVLAVVCRDLTAAAYAPGRGDPVDRDLFVGAHTRLGHEASFSAHARPTRRCEVSCHGESRPRFMSKGPKVLVAEAHSEGCRQERADRFLACAVSSSAMRSVFPGWNLQCSLVVTAGCWLRYRLLAWRVRPTLRLTQTRRPRPGRASAHTFSA